MAFPPKQSMRKAYSHIPFSMITVKCNILDYPILTILKRKPPSRNTSVQGLRGVNLIATNLGDYTKRYLEMDVRQLCDVYENFRSLTREQSGLDGAHYITISQFALSAALKKINRKISLCPSPEMYRLFEKYIRGGLAFCNKLVVTASNEHAFPGVGHNDKSLMYIDENNLYGAALRMKLPVKDFKFLEPNTVNIDWKTIDTEGDIGYLLEVDLLYPKAIHDKTQHFPLAPEDFEITDAHLSSEMRVQLRALNGCRENDLDSPMKSCRKLVANCFNKSNYVVHFKTLQFYLRQGLEITHIHSIVQFGQAAIYRDYIDFNTNERSKATSDFKKSYYKQIHCSLFGKSMEDVRNRMKVHMMSNAADYQHEVAKPHF